MAIDAVFSKMKERIGFLPLEDFIIDPNHNKDYLVNCHWALYCDNYLEGFHIPFVHPELNDALANDGYSTECFENAVLQVGMANEGAVVNHSGAFAASA